MMVDPRRVEEFLRLLGKRYPEWNGFSDGRFLSEETAPKRETASRAGELLAWAALQGLLKRGEYAAFIERVEKAGRMSNLLYRGTPRQGDLGILYSDHLDKASFCEAILDLLYGTDATPARLERYAAYVAGHKLPNRWTFPTYLLSICHPESELFVQPSTMRWALQFFGRGSLWRRTPNQRTYSALLRVAAGLKEAMARFAPRDMIDLQSAIWIAWGQSDTGRYWKISPGEDAWQWEECRRGNFIGVGWELFGDISRMSRPEFDLRYREILRSFPELRSAPEWSKNAVAQLWTFARIRQGDVIVANRGTTGILGTGRVVGPYYFVPGQRNGHRVPVLWNDTPREVQEEGWRRTLLELNEREFTGLHADPPPAVVSEADAAAEGPAPEPSLRYGAAEDNQSPSPAVAEAGAGYATGEFGETPPEAPPLPAYSLEECAEDTGFPAETLREWTRAIERKGQAILYGPPGTGKTYLAEHLARHLAGGSDGFVRLVQLHPAYAYEDFVIGIRPRPRPEGGLDYPLVPGRFVQFCEEARLRSGPCVLVLDEINRANLARVFGELMYLLEYRDAEVPLAGGRTFSIPRNVRIIGTMNTADRSIALVDHALRRRFAFMALGPSYDVLRGYHERSGSGFPAGRLITLLQRLNREIGDPHYEVGISYFLRAGLAGQIEEIWRTEIEPYLEEYFFDRPGKADEFRWNAIAKELLG